MVDSAPLLQHAPLSVDGLGIPLVIAGEGRPVLVFGPGFAGSTAQLILARRFRVMALDTADPLPGLPAAASSWIEGQKLPAIGLLGIGGFAALAVETAAVTAQTNAMVLVSPHFLATESTEALAGLASVKAPKAVLLGTADQSMPPSAPARIRRNVPGCNVVMVYEAGVDIAADRPEAFARVTGDFFDRPAQFLFMIESVALQP